MVMVMAKLIDKILVMAIVFSKVRISRVPLKK